MLDHPIRFVLINLILYFLILAIFGFNAAFPLCILFSFFIIIYNYKKIGLKESLILAIIYLLAFDNEIFYFSTFNIRIWYFYLIIVYILTIVEMLFQKKYTIKKIFLFESLLGFVFFIWSIYFLTIEDFTSNINSIKYWLFYVGLILSLNSFFIEKQLLFDKIIDYIISIFVFVMLWGILQFFTNLVFYPNFQIDYYNIRPSAFFSETTWYSEFSFFGLLLVLLKIMTKEAQLKLLYLVPFFFAGFLFSITRNTFLALLIYLFLTFSLTILFDKKIPLKIVNSWFVKVVLVLLVITFIVYLPYIFELSKFFELKFSGKDDSAQGRIEAFNISINNIVNGNILGNGYYWNKDQSTESGSALGSKSFNLFLMMGSIFGVFGGILFVILVFGYLFKLLYYYYKFKSIYIKYSFIIFICFVQMAMFAPIHQFPFGMLIVSLSVFLFYKGVQDFKNKQLL